MKKAMVLKSNQGNHRGFNRKWEVLDFMRDASIEKLNQALRIHDVVGRSKQFHCASDKDNGYEMCEEQCYLCKMAY